MLISSRNDQGSPCNLSFALLEAGVELGVIQTGRCLLFFCSLPLPLHSPKTPAAARGGWQEEEEEEEERKKWTRALVADMHWKVGLRLGFVGY